MTVRASPPGTPPRTSYSSRSEHPVWFPGDFAGPSHGAPSISFGAPSMYRMSITASGDGFMSSEDEGAGAAPLGCCRHRRTGPRADGHACPGNREYQTGGQQTAQSRALAGWMIGFSERGAAHNCTLLRCLFSRRCMRS